MRDIISPGGNFLDKNLQYNAILFKISEKEKEHGRKQKD
ncbi:MAG: hypothetical protein H6Q04_2268 [Acidobacteria bacterium]|nr:hypothetical protein [Acidobacteriota bacterium]